MKHTFDRSSPRLTLRPVRPDDVDALHRHWTNPDVRRYLWDDVVSRADVADIVAESGRRFLAHGHGLWALRRASGDDLIGCVGFWTFHESPDFELVVGLSPEWWGRGLAAEAVGVLLRHAFDTLGLTTVHASTDVPNTASRRLIDRLGFSFSHEVDVDGRPTRFYTLSVSEYRSSHPRRVVRP